MDAAAVPIFTLLLLGTAVLLKPSDGFPGFHHFGVLEGDDTWGRGNDSDGGVTESSKVEGGGVGEMPHKRNRTCTTKNRSDMIAMDPNAYKALQAWKSAITEDPNGVLASWVGPDVCSYWGVFCSNPPPDNGDPYTRKPSAQTVVAVIDLNGASLKGSLVDDLVLLTNLSTMHLNSNRFCGTFPAALASLRHLTEVDLSNNHLSGPFPSAVLSLPNLAYLDLRFNNFSGNIPPDLFRKPTLDAIFLNDNLFHGNIPCNLWKSSASVVSLANNRLAGKIPTKFGGMVPSTGRLQELLFLNNSLRGCIPKEIGLLLQLNVLDVSDNSLTGSLPPNLGCLKGLELLNVAHNRLSGKVPEEVCAIKSLVNLNFSFNFFSGLAGGCNAQGGGQIPGFDFSGNCMPGLGMQRPSPQCRNGISGGGRLRSMTAKTNYIRGNDEAIKGPNVAGGRGAGFGEIPSF